MVDLTASPKRIEIAQKAKELSDKYKNSIYSQRERSTEKMDCSYFVYLVFKEIFPDYKYLNTDGIVSSPLFRKSVSPGLGDVIFFAKGTVPHELKSNNRKIYDNHVGIVTSSTMWTGRQTRKLTAVAFRDVWWWPRGPKFYSYVLLDGIS